MFSSKTWKVSPRQLSTTTTTLPPSLLLFFHLTILLVFLSPTENHQSHKSKLGLWLRTTLLRQNNKRYQCTHTLHTSFFTSLHGVCTQHTEALCTFPLLVFGRCAQDLIQVMRICIYLFWILEYQHHVEAIIVSIIQPLIPLLYTCLCLNWRKWDAWNQNKKK